MDGHIWKYGWTLPTIGLSVILIRTELQTEGCFGLVEAIITLLLLGLLGLSLIITLIVQIFKMIEKKDIIHRLFIILICLVSTALAVAISFLPREQFQSRATMKAKSMNSSLVNHELTLREDMTYTATRRYIEWTCYYVGKYRTNNDTLFLEQKVVEQTDSIFSSRYLIQEDHLLPLNRSDYLTNQDYWLEIKIITGD